MQVTTIEAVIEEIRSAIWESRREELGYLREVLPYLINAMVEKDTDRVENMKREYGIAHIVVNITNGFNTNMQPTRMIDARVVMARNPEFITMNLTIPPRRA